MNLLYNINSLVQKGVILCFVLVLLVACAGKEIKELDTIDLQDRAGVERATGVEVLYSDSSVVRVQLKAPTLLRYNDKYTPKQVFPDGIDADFYNERQQQTSKLVAKYAEQYQKQQKIYLRDSVHIWNNKSEHLEAEELIWDEKQERIYSDKFVKITTPEQIIRGYRLESNLDFTRWELDSVTGIIESKNMIDAPF